MNNLPEHTSLTLEDITRQKAELLAQIRQHQQEISRLSKQLIDPLRPATNKGNSIVRAFNTSLAVIDGIKMGLKLMRSFRKVFRKRSW